MTEPTPEQRAEARRLINERTTYDFSAALGMELDVLVAALIAARDAARALILKREAEADRLRLDIDWLAEERATAIIERDAARAAHARLREVAEMAIVVERWDDDFRLGAFLLCLLCQTRSDHKSTAIEHAPDCPLAPLPEETTP